MIELQVQKSLWSVNQGLELSLDIRLPAGRCVAVYGASGAGKTTLLRMIAGLMEPDQGKIVCERDVWFDTTRGINLLPQQRSVGFLFQDYALFPNMSVRENLEFALGKGDDKAAIAELVAIMELEPLQKRKPHTLSGGQKQRVALARALVQQPRVLLLDEPLSALDLTMRHRLQDYLLEIRRRFQPTTLLVSHDIAEIFRLADEVIVLEDGTVKRQGSPAHVFQHHAVSGKFQFLGEVVAIEAQDFLWIVSVLVGTRIVRIIADESESLELGDRVIVASKAFNPVIQKIRS
ncbi:MAG: ATP-binding cassette domain-containing protein [Cyanobacteria bacterium P01_F01_bin.42]